MSEIDTKLQEPPPEHCPGTESKDAGNASACQGCPNQKICASAVPKGPDPDVNVIAERLRNVKRKILILSGKGGVGKSTVSSMLARGLTTLSKNVENNGMESSEEVNVGVLDIDLCGPSLPRIFGVEGEQVHRSGSGWSPVYVEDNLSLMSAGFLLPSLDSAVIWRGPKKNGLIKQLLRDVDWGEGDLDYLIIDTPPGTGDEHLSITQYMREAKLDGAIVVTTPQEIALLDVRKQISFCRKVDLPILGIIENMSVFICPTCNYASSILPNSTGGAEKLCQDTGLKLIGKVPLDPTIGQFCDEGKNLFSEDSNNKVVKEYENIVQAIFDELPV